MKVIVVGAHGEVGEHVIEKLAKGGYESLAVVGKDQQEEATQQRGATETAVYDENLLESMFHGYDAVIYLSDVHPKSHTDKTVLVDHSAVVGTVQAAERQGVKRFVMLSAVKAAEETRGPDAAGNIGAKDMVDEHLRNSQMTYTIIKTSKLTDRPGEGTIAVNDPDDGELARDDAAAVLVESIRNEGTFNKTFTVSSGNKDIASALSNL